MKEIGRRLRAAREARGIDLQKAEEETRIRRKYLEALETGHEADLPGEAYLKGFLRTYGNYLGMDGPALVAEYKEHKAPPSEVAATVHSPSEPVAKVAEPVQPERPPVHTEPPKPVAVARAMRERPAPRRRSDSPWIYSRQAGYTLVAFAAIGVLAYFGWRVLGQAKVQEAKPPVQTEPTTPTSETPTTPTTPPPPEPVKVSMTKGPRDEVHFAVGAKEIQVRVEPNNADVWMRATADGKITYDGKPKSPLEFKGGAIELRIGHMNGIGLEVNGTRFDKALESGPYTLYFESK